MYNCKDLERSYFQYQTEEMLLGIASIKQFCSRNEIP